MPEEIVKFPGSISPSPSGKLSLRNDEVSQLPSIWVSSACEAAANLIRRCSLYLGHCDAGLVIILPLDEASAIRAIEDLRRYS